MRKNILKKMVKATAMVLTTATVITAAFVVQPTEAVQAAKKPTLNKTYVSLYKGWSAQLKVKNAPKATKVTWKSSKKKVAEVRNGLVIAKKKGSCKITAKVGSKKLTCLVSVKNGVKTKKKTLHVGESFLALGMYDFTADMCFSGNDTIINTNRVGKVTAVGTGKTRVLVRSNGKMYTIWVTVVKGSAKAHKHSWIDGPTASESKMTFNNPTYQACSKCHEKFLSYEDLMNHFESVHNRVGNYGTTGQTFTSNKNCVRFCEICGVTEGFNLK